MENYIEARNIILNQKTWDTIEHKWIPFDDVTRERAFNDLKSFVAATARGNRRRRIMSAGYYNVSDWGILRRLWWYPETGKVEYCCGQDWTNEMAILRDAFDWKVR